MHSPMIVRSEGSTAAARTPYLSIMANVVRVSFAVLASILTLVAVVAIKRGIEVGIAGWSLRDKSILLAGGLASALTAVAWTYLLPPRLLRRRQQREDAGLRERRIGDASGDAVGTAANSMRLEKVIQDARSVAGRRSGQR